MKQIILLTILLFAAILLSSCQKEEVFTDLEIIENNLTTFVDDQDIKTCSILFLGEEQNIQGPQFVSFKIKDGFLIVEEEPYVQYNLLHLLSYYQYEGDLTLIFTR